MMICRWFGHKWEHPRSITEYRPVCVRCGVKYGRENP